MDTKARKDKVWHSKLTNCAGSYKELSGQEILMQLYSPASKICPEEFDRNRDENYLAENRSSSRIYCRRGMGIARRKSMYKP